MDVLIGLNVICSVLTVQLLVLLQQRVAGPPRKTSRLSLSFPSLSFPALV